MTAAPLPDDEGRRLDALRAYEVLDTDDDPHLERIVRLAARLTDAPIVLVSLVDAERQWFKACIGLDTRETDREIAFCAWAILTPEDQFVVEDATHDHRFRDNPLVTGPPHIRAYAGTPLVTPGGHAIGTLCAIDDTPRPFTEEQLAGLADLAELTIDHLEHRIATSRLRATVLDEVALASTEPDEVARSLTRTLDALRTTERLPVVWARLDLDGAPDLPIDAPAWPDPELVAGVDWRLAQLDEVPEAVADHARTHGAWSLLAIPLRRSRDRFATVVLGLPDGTMDPARISRAMLVTERFAAAYGQASDRQARTAAEREVLRRAAEVQTARAMQEVRQRISSTLGHHVRTPLAVLRGAAQHLPGAPDAERDELLEAIGRQAQRLDALLEDLLDVVLGAPSFESDLTRARVDEVVQQAVESKALEDRSVSLDLQPIEAAITPDRIHRCVVALLDNVARHTPTHTHVSVVVTDAGDRVLISVADDGPGMPDALKARAFLPFEQGPSAAAHAPGVGLGLALVAATAQLHGGRAWAEDAGAGGARVVIELPTAGPQPSPVNAQRS